MDSQQRTSAPSGDPKHTPTASLAHNIRHTVASVTPLSQSAEYNHGIRTRTLMLTKNVVVGGYAHTSECMQLLLNHHHLLATARTPV